MTAVDQSMTLWTQTLPPGLRY